jgi:hypothetical protein
MIYHGGPLQQRFEGMGAGHLPTKGGARGGRSSSIIVRMRSLGEASPRLWRMIYRSALKYSEADHILRPGVI